MRKFSAFLLLLLVAGMWGGCKKDTGNYPGATVSPYIAIFDIRNIYKGSDVTLTQENMFGATQLNAVVVSDHSAGNIPEGFLVVQENRRLNRLRGLVIPVGAAAATYVPGDSVIINIVGGVLKNIDGILQLTGITPDKITKKGTGPAPVPLVEKSNNIIANPGDYEGVLVSVIKAGFDPNLPAGSTYEGDRIMNDGFGNMVLHTEPAAPWADSPLPFLSNFTGIIFRNAAGEATLWPRVDADITVLSATAPRIAPIIITGFLADPTGTDANYEYIQLMATRDINFGTTPFSIVTSNNAGTAQPTGFPTEGWATGNGRTYKFNLSSGSVSKGEYFYVGGNKNIWGAGSTDISSSKWFGKLYATVDGDGFGAKTTNLLANSGNAAGIAVFEKTTVGESDVPLDVIFYGGSGSLYTATPPERGYRITNTDYYDIKHPTTQAEQPFFNMGSNTGKFAFPTAANFAQLGGTYNYSTGRWTSARIMVNVPLTATSTVAAIEGATTIEQ